MTYKWISVKNRLPEIGVPVLCLKKSKECFVGSYAGGNYSDNYAAFKHSDVNMAIGVSHWMPLPELPEEIKNENVKEKMEEKIDANSFYWGYI